MYGLFRIPRTLAVVASCWERAEEEVRAAIRVEHRGIAEETITEIFCGRFARTLIEVNAGRGIEQAFVQDLGTRFPDIEYHRRIGIGRGLIANATLHARDTEGVTGGDLGLVISRPQVTRSNRNYLKIDRSYSRGILCQAKLKAVAGRWGQLSERQVALLADQLEFWGLLLYRYLDLRRTELDKFTWQLGHGAALDEVLGWLSNDSFPELMTSSAVILALGEGEIGTDDWDILERIIAPIGNRYLEIRIDWPNGGPSGEVEVLSRQESQERVAIRLRA